MTINESQEPSTFDGQELGRTAPSTFGPDQMTPEQQEPGPQDQFSPAPGAHAMRRKKQLKMLAWGAAAIATIIGLVVGGIAIYNGVTEAKAERVEVVDTYDGAYASYQAFGDAWGKSEAAVTHKRAEIEASDVTKDDDSGKTFLAAWDKLLSASQQDADKALGTKRLPASATNDELREGTRTVTKLGTSVETELAALNDAESNLDVAIAERTEAVRAAKVAAELQAKKAAAQPVTYESLFRAGDEAAGSYYTFTGKIIQAVGESQYRVSITADPGYSRTFWKDPILLMLNGDPSQRLLEDDIISFTAASLGVTSYDSIFKQTIQIPLVMADAADVAVTGRDN